MWHDVEGMGSELSGRGSEQRDFWPFICRAAFVFKTDSNENVLVLIQAPDKLHMDHNPQYHLRVRASRDSQIWLLLIRFPKP